MNKVVIFDFDGTICNTFSDCVLCYNQVLREHGFPERKEEVFASVFGRMLHEIVAEVLPEDSRDEETVNEIANAYRACYKDSEKKNSLPFPGVPEVLKALSERGIFLAVNSNKLTSMLSGMTEKAFPDIEFAAIVGASDALPGKPDPAGVDFILQELDVPKEAAVYVGDGKSDILTAGNAGIPAVYVSWGQGKKEGALPGQVVRQADTAEELLREILELLGEA